MRVCNIGWVVESGGCCQATVLGAFAAVVVVGGSGLDSVNVRPAVSRNASGCKMARTHRRIRLGDGRKKAKSPPTPMRMAMVIMEGLTNGIGRQQMESTRMGSQRQFKRSE